MMKFSKILLIIGIVALASVFVMNASFAASSEELSVYKGSGSLTTDKKVSTIIDVSKFQNDGYKEYCKINIKKAYQKKYKIKSVNIRYSVIDTKTYKFKNYLYKNYTVNNKNSFIVNVSGNDSVSFDKLTVNYQTKGKIKNESITSSYTKGELKYNTYFDSNKANAYLFQKVYLKNDMKDPFTVKYQKIKVLTKNKKYKIKTIKLAFSNAKTNKISYSTFKGYGKNSLIIKLYQNKIVQGIKVYYY